MPLARRHVLALLLPLLLAASVPAVPAAAQMTDPAETTPRIRAQQRAMMLKKKMRLISAAAARQHQRQAVAADAIRAFGPDRWMRPSRASALAAIEASKASPRTAEGPGKGRRRTIDEIEPGYVPPDAAARARRASTAAISGFVPPANVIANNRAGDGAFAGQCEQDIAAHGSNILVAWNDGEGFNDFTGDTQGYGYSTNGGASFTDGGKLPKPVGMPTFIWTSDPIVTVNEKTGEFWYAGLCSPSSGRNGIGVVKGTFSGSNLNWGTPVIVRDENDGQFFLDKLWMVADSSSGNLYMTYTEFNPGSDEINFRRSTDGGTVWSLDQKINGAADDGAVQGSRPVVAGNGNVHVVYHVIGGGDSDFIKHKMSTNGGVSFGVTISTAATFHPNFGTGAPGFNREMGIQFPSIAVDRSGGANHGRVYVAWNECVNWLDEAFSTGVGKYEVEPNGTAPQATPITIGQPVRGFLSLNTGENDYFSFGAAAGQTYLFWCDSLNTAQLYTMRIFCSDQNTRLAFSGDTQFGGEDGFIVWTAPANATYYLRMANLPTGGPTTYTTGGYRILTKMNTVGLERGRDQRDAFVSSSTNGLSWSTPTRVNDDAGLYDNWLPEVEVGGNGIPYVLWYDWRDAAATCGGQSHVYLARSDNAGASWVSLGPVTDTPSDWTNGFSNIAPNQGDYLALYANDQAVYNAWADARNGDPDVFVSVWSLMTTPVQIALASVSARPDRVEIAWFAGGDPLDHAIVERRTESSDEWGALGTIYVDGNNRLSFSDTDVMAGMRYAYRLRIEDGGRERLVGETWVDVPARTGLSIASIRPNPARRDAWVTFSLASSAPATLSLLDIAGRLIREREVGSYGAGTHQLNLIEQGALEPGMYLVRITQGTSSETSRLSVIR